jgi:DNA phosphorothioation-dependent restriction protein DptH
MQSMSNQPFNIFLAEKLISWLSYDIKLGKKYRFYSDNEQNLQALYYALLSLAKDKLDFRVSSTEETKTFQIPYIDLTSCKLLVVTDTDVEERMDPSFIANLRDALLDFQDDVALMIVLRSGVDTLLSTTEEVSLPTLPLHPKVIKQDIEKLIDTQTEKKVIYQVLLERQSKIIQDDGQSTFGLQTIYESIKSNKINFKEYNLFDDPGLFNVDKKSIEKRLTENDTIYRKVQNTIRDFPNELNEKLSEFSPAFIKKHFDSEKKNWEETAYAEIISAIEEHKEQSIAFDETSMIYDFDCVRSDSDTSAGKRKKNIIIETDEEFLTLNFAFIGKAIKKEQFSIRHNKSIEKAYEIEIFKRQTAKLSLAYNLTPTYFTLSFKGEKSSEQYLFKVLLLKKGTFYLSDIQHRFLIDPKKNEVIVQTDDFKLRFHPNENTASTLLQKSKTDIDITTYHTIDFEQYYNQHDEVRFSIYNGEAKLNLYIEGSRDENSVTPPFLLNTNMLERLFGKNKDIEFNSTKSKAIFDNREFPILFERLTLIRYEYSIIEQMLVSNTTEQLFLEELKLIDSGIYATYTNLLEYFKQHKTTPSLAAWNDTLCEVAQSFVDSYLQYTNKIEHDSPLSDNDKKMFEFGFMNHDGLRMMSPFSPLVIAYILHLVDHAKNDPSYPMLPDVTLKRLNPKGLFPYLFIDSDTFAFTQVSRHNALWLEFVPNEESAFSYIRKLTREKIEEFIDSFEELFTFRRDAPLIINSINNHTNRELFDGIVDYYTKYFSNNPVKMVVNLFDDTCIQTEFDTFADTDKYDQIKRNYNLREDAESIIDTIRTHVTYSKHLTSEPQGYSHLSFFKNNEKVAIQSRTFEQTKSGLVSSGLISGESSQKEKGTYFSGFGLRNIDISQNKLLQLAKIYNALQRPVYDYGTNYEPHKTVALMISEQFKKDLKKSYENSLWTIIIDPKVTLEFFHNEENLILIHYSDQYSSSANYDAITVTAQKELYSNVILPEHEVGDKENLVKQFNAFNGEWLIKMITADEKTKKEHVSTITAYKYITALLDADDYTWVPLSVAEMIRVSGNIGLPMDGSDFSRYNARKLDDAITAGAISDDILLFGFHEDGVVLYPVEVKSSTAQITKAVSQAKSLKRYFYEHLFERDSFKTKLLKGLFIRQVFMQIEKYELYNTFRPEYFKPLHDKREELLEGTYSLSELNRHSFGAVVAFLNDQHTGKFESIDDEILVIKLPYIYQNKMLELSFEEIQKKLQKRSFDTNEKYFLKASKPIVKMPASHNIEDLQLKESLPEVVIHKKLVPAIESVASNQPLEIQFGTSTLTNEKIFWHPTNTTENQNTCTGIIGRSGTGKTQFTKSLVTQLVNQSHNNVTGSKIDMLIFDYKGDYIDDEFINTTGSKTLKPFRLPYNPLALYGNQDLLPIHATNLFITTISKAFGLGQVQKAKLDDIITRAYERKGIFPVDEQTWKNPAPTMQDVWEIFEEDDNAPIDSLYAALKKIQKFQIFEPKSENTKPLYDVIDGITVIKLTGYDTDIQNLIVAITLDLFYTQMHIKGSSIQQGDFRQITKMILVDEADNFMSQDFESLKKILKEGREFGVGTILSTQELTHFKTSENSYTDYIFTWIVHKVANIRSQDIQSIFNISNKAEAENLMSQVRELPKHQSFYVDGNKEISLMQDLAFWELLKEKENEN